MYLAAQEIWVKQFCAFLIQRDIWDYENYILLTPLTFFMVSFNSEVKVEVAVPSV